MAFVPPTMCHDSIYGKCTSRRCQRQHLGAGVQLYDSHCHLDILLKKHSFRLSDVIRPNQFAGMITNFCHPDNYHLFDTVMNQSSLIWASVGVHPKFASSFGRKEFQMKDKLNNPRVVAVGECGLDYTYADPNDPFAVKQQKDAFCWFSFFIILRGLL